MNMRKHWFILLAILAGTTYAAAQTDTSGAPPWIKAQAVLDATESAVKAGGIHAAESHVADIEQVLSEGPKAFVWRGPSDSDTVVLTGGAAETIVAMGAVSESKVAPNHKIVAVNNPYPMLSLYLGSYYNEIGKPGEALRVLDAGLKLFAVPDMQLGEHLTYLISERGAALEALKRWDDALANYDDGLRITDMADEDRARLFRGRGYALTELNRLDDAEEAYKNSLKLDPDSSLAQNELRYIAGLKAGALRQPSGQLTLSHPEKTQ